MALTTHEKIRVEAGFQSRFIRQAFRNDPDGSQTTFYADSDDNIKFVPEFGTGNTVAGISDVKVWVGLSGVFGVSRMGVSGVDISQGSVQVDTAPDSGASLVIDYASSSLPGDDIEAIRREAEALVRQRAARCYNLLEAETAPYLQNLAARYAAALLLVRNFGKSSRTTAVDGYALLDQLIGENAGIINRGTDSEVADVGEIGQICQPGFVLVDADGEIIDRTDANDLEGVEDFQAGGRVTGRIYDITEENFRLKDWQNQANTEQAGSGL
jgi:hypothetical protein